MTRTCLRSAVFTIAVVISGSAMAQGAYTTRIEPRGFYGASVTIEEGVRVFRPLPPERQVIINPNGTPLSLSRDDTRIIQRSTSYNRHVHAFTGAPYFYRHCIPAVGDSC